MSKWLAFGGFTPFPDADILLLADDYKMPVSEFRARFTESEIRNIKLLRAAQDEAFELKNPKK